MNSFTDLLHGKTSSSTPNSKKTPEKSSSSGSGRKEGTLSSNPSKEKESQRHGSGNHVRSSSTSGRSTEVNSGSGSNRSKSKTVDVNSGSQSVEAAVGSTRALSEPSLPPIACPVEAIVGGSIQDGGAQQQHGGLPVQTIMASLAAISSRLANLEHTSATHANDQRSTSDVSGSRHSKSTRKTKRSAG